VRIALTGREGRTYYRAMYTPVNGAGLPAVDAVVDARTGATVDTPEMRAFGMRIRAEGLLGGVVLQAGASAVWRSTSAPAAQRGFAAAETAGGRELRATLDDWIASVNAFTQNGALVVNVSYTVPNRGTQLARFRYDPVSDKATRTSP